MVSKQCIQMMGFRVNVYGLDEYKKLPSNTPLGVMIGLHGKYHDQRQLEKSCQAVCGINEKRKRMDRYIIAVTFDCPNHGSRNIYKENSDLENSPLREKIYFGIDLYVSAVETSHNITQFIDVFELYVFGPNHRHPVEKWGAMAFSLGAHALFMTISRDPRITTFISMAGTANFIGLVKTYYPYLKVPADVEQRAEYYEWAEYIQKDIHKKIRNVHLLAIYGGKDKVVNSVIGKKTAEMLRKNHSGRENDDWKVLTIPELDHYISRQSIAEAVQWIDRWMVRRESELTAKL